MSNVGAACTVLALLLLTTREAPAVPISFFDDFEGETVGAFPSKWLDIGLVEPNAPNPPNPSAVVVQTTDAFGNPTKALATIDAIAESQGIYRNIPLSARYISNADVRIDRFSENSVATVQDWAMAVGINRFVNDPLVDPAFTPSAQIYASSFDQHWRLYLVTENMGVDLDYGIFAELGTWYRVGIDLDVNLGTIASRIVKISTGDVLVDRVDSLNVLDALDGFDQGGAWDPTVDGIFDAEGFFDGELSGDTAALAVVDNVDQEVVPVPEPSGVVLLSFGLFTWAGIARRSRRRP